MNKAERIYLLDQILKNSRYPVSKNQLMERLECSQATLYRIVAELRDAYAAPLESTEQGFYYSREEHFELPGLRLTSEEIQGLLMVSQLLEDIESDALKMPLQRLLDKVQLILGEHGITTRKSIRIVRALSREPDKRIFTTVLSALQSEKNLSIDYRARSTGDTTQRTISPQQLTSYKNAWYLDAWCHLRTGIRSFALEQVDIAKIDNDTDYMPIQSQQLRQHFSSSYGIFSGQASQTASILFDASKAAWASSERWHSQQKLEWQADGSVLIHIPFHHEHELLMDILRYGAAAEVKKPDALRLKMADILNNAAQKYI
ncbi:helix-turn-helix transcriptional regulator [Marinicella sp. W31]|uniref:helix-turn-helix transcriptional regulator n=1 Tax=Marinicella sp. W31 TaxID=3023713 RepID=UPI003758136B